jgi:hypothetical protein
MGMQKSCKNPHITSIWGKEIGIFLQLMAVFCLEAPEMIQNEIV